MTISPLPVQAGAARPGAASPSSSPGTSPTGSTAGGGGFADLVAALLGAGTPDAHPATAPTGGPTVADAMGAEVPVGPEGQATPGTLPDLGAAPGLDGPPALEPLAVEPVADAATLLGPPVVPAVLPSQPVPPVMPLVVATGPAAGAGADQAQTGVVPDGTVPVAAPSPTAGPSLPVTPAGAPVAAAETPVVGTPDTVTAVATRATGPTGTPTAAADPAAPDLSAGGPGQLAAPTAVAAPTGPASVAAPAADVTTTGVCRQVAAEVLRLAESGPRHDSTRHVTLQLNPAALGEVRVTLSLRAGAVRVRLSAGSEVARLALAEGMPELRRLLAGVGAAGAEPGQVGIVVADLAGPANPGRGPGSDADLPSDLLGGHEGHDGRSGHDEHDRAATHDAPRAARTPLGPTATDGPRRAAGLPPVDDQPPSTSPRRVDVSV